MQTWPTKFVTVDTIKTHYIDEGNSDIPIVLVHGINAHLGYWHKNIAALAKTHRVIALDLIGFGDSDKPKINYRLNILTKFLKSFIDELKIKKCYLVGHSMGGAVCLKFAIDYPDSVKKLILVSSAGFDGKLPLLFRLGTLPIIGPLFIKTNKKKIAHGIKLFLYKKNAVDKKFIQNCYRITKLPGALHTTITLLRHHADFSGIHSKILQTLSKGATQLTMPVMIIWGQEDNLLKVIGAHNAKKLIPQAELHIFDKCGHAPQLEYPEEFNALIKKFCV